MSIKTRVGKLVKVKNQGKKKSANDTYQAVILNSNGQYNPYLFTDVEIAVAYERGRKNIEDQVERSVMSKILD
jgi:uncharacterized metal-binding protein